MTATRRQRLRTATIEEIKRAALELMANRGVGALSMRGIARSIGMSPAGLYRYFDGLDALITDLITDAYNDLADHVAAAAGGEEYPRARLREAMLAYRRWCLAHRDQFLLIFGTPIPGYVAPSDGPTEIANQRIGETFFAVGAEAWRRGDLRPVGPARPPEPNEREFAETVAPGFPPEIVGAFLSTWAHFHGLVTLEILNQLQWMYPNPETFYQGEMERIIDQFFPE